MTYDPEDQAERRRVLRNDERVRNGDTGTYLSHTHSEVGGRFAVTEHQTITGVVSPAPPPLPANSPWAGRDPVPDEPSLGYAINEAPIVGEPHEVAASIAALNPFSDPEPSLHSPAQATDDPADASSSGSSPASYGGSMSEPAGSSPLSESEINKGEGIG